MPTSPTLNEALAASATQLLDFVRKAAENAEGFVIEQTPLFIQEYLHYHGLMALIFAILGSVLLLVVLPLLILTSYKFGKRASGPGGIEVDIAVSVISGVFSFVIAVTGITMTANNLPDYIKIKTAPRVYIVDKLLNQQPWSQK